MLKSCFVPVCSSAERGVESSRALGALRVAFQDRVDLGALRPVKVSPSFFWTPGAKRPVTAVARRSLSSIYFVTYRIPGLGFKALPSEHSQ
jgi:hypothetical protein